MRKSLSSIGFLLASFAAPFAAIAGPASVDNYAFFDLNDNLRSLMQSDEDKACEARAARTPDDISKMIACYDVQAARFESRLEVAYRGARNRLSPLKRQCLRADQRNWVQNGFRPCETKWSAELNIQSSAYGLAIAKCNTHEWYRRAIWVEHYR